MTVRVGVVVTCAVCDYMKKPIGRSVPLGVFYCDDECSGYRQDPRPGSLWPGERSDEFGYPVGLDGTVPVSECPFCAAGDGPHSLAHEGKP